MGLNRRERIRKGPRGKGDIKVLKSETRVYSYSGGAAPDVYHIAPSEEPVVVNGWTVGNVTGAFVELTEDETEIKSVRPWSGAFYFVFDRFAGRKDMPPTIKHIEMSPPNQYRDWPIPAHDECYSILKIVGDKAWSGIEVVKPLWYQFAEDPAQPGVMEISYDSKTKWAAKQFLNFLEVAGFDFDADTLARSANVLNELQTILRKRDVVFQGNMERGYLQKELNRVPEGTKIVR